MISVPILLTVAALTLMLGQDHPAGRWSQRHSLPATALAIKQGHKTHLDRDEEVALGKDEKHLGDEVVDVRVADDAEHDATPKSSVDVAVNESLTLESAIRILTNPLTWLPALAYLTTFGLELALDGQMATVLYGLFSTKIDGFDQTTAGYYTAVLYVDEYIHSPFSRLTIADSVGFSTSSHDRSADSQATGCIQSSALEERSTGRCRAG